MASIDNAPSQSLINAAFASLAVGGSVAVTVGAAALVAPIAALISPGLAVAAAANIVQLYYSVLVPSVSAAGQSIPRQTLQGSLQVDMKCLATEFNHDFTNIRDVGTTHVRGNQPYERPCGSYRIALKVKDKFGNDNVWLGMTGNTLGEWPVSYHGTAQHNALNIAEEGYKLCKGERSL